MNTQETILAVIAEISGVGRDDITPHSELVADLGIDSPKALAMLVELEDRLGTELDDELVTRLNTVGDVLRAIDRRG